MVINDKSNLHMPGLTVPSVRYVLQITGSVRVPTASNEKEIYSQVRNRIIDWVQSKCPKSLPGDAKEGVDFEIDIPGHKFISTTLPNSTLWVTKIEHPSDDGHIWSVEAEVAIQKSEILFGVRSYRSAVGGQFTYPARSTPTFVRDIVRQFGLYDCSKAIQEESWQLDTQDDLLLLMDILSDPNRVLPVVLVSSANAGQDEEYVIDHNYLAYKTVGLAHVVILPYSLAFAWTDLVGKEWSAFRGAVRTYHPGLSFEEDDPSAHPLSTNYRIMNWEAGAKVGAEAFVKFLIGQLYYQSVSGPSWRSRFASFADVKAKRLAEFTKTSVAVDEAAVNMLKEQVAYLEEEKEAAESLAQESEIEKNATQSELTRLNNRLFYLQSQNDQLLRRLREVTDEAPDTAIDFPASLDDLSEWVEKYLPGRVVLHPRGIRAAKKSLFENVRLVFDALLFLANEYRNMRMGVGEDAQDLCDKRLGELKLELSRSISPSRAGEEGDQYIVKYPPGSHRTRSLDMHLKNGTSRDLRYCLRIYFFWDQESSQVVVGSLPAHLDTRAT